MKQAKNLTINNLRFHVIFRKEQEGGFTVTVPALPGCVTYEKNLLYATNMAREAISLYLEDMLEQGEKIPAASDIYLGDIEVNISKTKFQELTHA